MKILAVSHPCVTDVNQQFYAELEALGHTVQLVVPSNFRHEYADSPVTVTRWPKFQGAIVQRRVGMSGSIPLHYYQSNLRPIITAFRPDVLYVEEEPYSLSAWQAFYASRGLAMKRIVYSAQNIVKTYPLPFRWMEQYVFSKADATAVVSSEVDVALREKGYKGRVIRFPLGVDTTQFHPSSEARQQMRTELHLEDNFVVGYVGRFVEEKGIHTLIDALPLFKESNVKFLFVGNGPLLMDLQEAKNRFPDNVIIADSVSHRDVHRWFNAMDVSILPSITMPNWKEQFGRVIVESLACGVPVIGSDSGEIPILLGKTGGGWVFPEADIAKMKDVIYNVRNNEHKRTLKGREGYAAVQQTYSKHALAKAFCYDMSLG